VPRLGYTVHRRWTLEADLGISEGELRTVLDQSWRGLTPRMNVMVGLSPDTVIQPFFVAGAGAFRKSVLPAGSDNIDLATVDTDFLMNFGYGTFFRIVGPMMLRVDFRGLVNLGEEGTSGMPDTYMDWELTGGLAFRGSELKRDSDFDGVYDRFDVCADEPEDRDGWQDDDGCPDEDDDNDGVADADDDCPREAEDADGWQDRDGCPEWDNDGDHIEDADDRCPDQAEDLDGWEDNDGCPEADNDDDGVDDSADRCPLDAEDIDRFQDGDGCPDPDNDGDGIADFRDACPDARETLNDHQDTDGCPDVKPVVVPPPPPPPPPPDPEIERFTGVIHGINFKSGSASITLDSYKVLDEAAIVLIAHEDLRIEVQGHTDSDGPSLTNLGLSADRARSVVEYLINRGAEPRNLEWVGYGESRPLVPNEDKDSKAVNRRVEFRVVDDGSGEAP
jgi:outer membrane protein OmpA-like peptidoglycan-associated protein